MSLGMGTFRPGWLATRANMLAVLACVPDTGNSGGQTAEWALFLRNLLPRLRSLESWGLGGGFAPAPCYCLAVQRRVWMAAGKRDAMWPKLPWLLVTAVNPELFIPPPHERMEGLGTHLAKLFLIRKIGGFSLSALPLMVCFLILDISLPILLCCVFFLAL